MDPIIADILKRLERLEKVNKMPEKSKLEKKLEKMQMKLLGEIDLSDSSN